MTDSPLSTDPARPLSDITVLDLTVALAGPYATVLLAGLGARVIKIESAGALDSARNNAPYLGVDGIKLTRDRADDVSISELNRLRNKLGVSLDLKHPRAREVFADLVGKADVVVQNFSSGTLERLGAGYAAVRAINPRIVYCSISGFGSDDPGSGKAMDASIQALSGLMQVSGRPEDPPARIGLPIADLVTPLFGVIGILSALHMARRTGAGQHVDVSMLGAITSLMASEAFDVLERLGVPLRTGQTVPRLSPFGVYPAQTGHISICAPTDAFVRGVFRAMRRPELADDARFVTRDNRVKHCTILDALIEEWTRGLPAETLIARLTEHGVPAEVVRGPASAVRDPRVTARQECVPLTHPRYGATADVYGLGVPIKFSDAVAALDRPAPGFAEHNQFVYGELLGYSPERIAELRALRVI